MLFVFLLVFKGFNSVNAVGVRISHSLTVSVLPCSLKFVPAIALVLDLNNVSFNCAVNRKHVG